MKFFLARHRLHQPDSHHPGRPVGRDLQFGDIVVKVDPRYFRPAEVETLLGDPTKAKQKLGWEAKTAFEELVAEMVRADLEIAQRDELVKCSGYQVFNYNE